MKIVREDEQILLVFLAREASDFRLSDQGVIAYVDAIRRQIDDELAKIEKADYVHIKSLSNLGLMDRCLTLTPDSYKSGIDVTILLPPAPPSKGGKINVSVKNRYPK